MADLSPLHPVFRQRVEATGVPVYSGGRSTVRQGELYDGWVRRLPGYNPANPPGTSWHEYGPGIPGGRWTLAVDFEEPYPHGAPGLCFPIPKEPWHAQPAEITEGARVAGAELRLPTPDPGPPADPYDLKGRTMLVLDSSLKTYAIKTHAGKALDVPGFKVEDRARVQQYAPSRGKNQQWYFDLCGAGPDVYRIIAAHSGRVLDLAGPDGQGSAVWQFAWAGVPNQMWRVEEVKGGFIIASLWDTNLVVDVFEGRSDDEAPIIVWSRNGGSNQLFQIEG
jgi:hypothetical protein